jgi:hypothetical protein
MTTRHQELFEKYVDELQEVKSAVSQWWDSLLAQEETILGNHDAAAQSVKQRWPHGPSTHPYVVAVIRKYYFACNSLNEEIEEAERDSDSEEEADFIYPHNFVIDSLMEAEHYELAEFVATMPYLPIGLDPESNEFV